jgi:hypothetical protein
MRRVEGRIGLKMRLLAGKHRNRMVMRFDDAKHLFPDVEWDDK